MQDQEAKSNRTSQQSSLRNKLERVIAVMGQTPSLPDHVLWIALGALSVMMIDNIVHAILWW
jgi:hypothetical protein